MIKLEDLWVGDDVRISSSQETGKFQSISEGKALVRLSSGHSRLVAASDLEIHTPTITEPDPFPELHKPVPQAAKPDFLAFPSTIDLHIETLNPELSRARPERILMYQLEALHEYLEQVEAAGLKFFTIIHGKGKGVLKAETLHMLQGRGSVKFTVEAHNGGAVEVWLK